MSNGCIFCKIARGEIPSTRVYEDADTLAFLDIGPLVKGHTLVIPKAHHDPLMNTPDDVLAKMIATAKRVARAQVAGLKADGVNLHQSNGAVAGQVVPHIHIHVIPRFASDGHRWNWAARKYDSPAQMQQAAESIKSAMA